MGTIQVFPNADKNPTFPVSLIDISDLLLTADAANTTSGAWSEATVRHGYIVDVHEDGYQVIQAIPYTIERVNDTDFLASIESANVAITGTDWQDAYQSLIAELLDTFDTLRVEPNLSPDAAAQLATLNDHIVKA